MALSFQATMAQEESHSKSRCMEQSLRMRLDHGIPLTPDRIGFRKDKISGKLFVCEDEYETVKLAYFMVLLGYTTDEIAEIYPDYRYKLIGKVIKSNEEYLIVFDLTSTEVYKRTITEDQKVKISRVPVFPQEWQNQFGLPFEEHRKSLQVNIFDGYAVYGFKEGTVTPQESADGVSNHGDEGIQI